MRIASAESWVDRAMRHYDSEPVRIKHPLRKRAIMRQEYLRLICQYHPRHKYRLIWELLWSVGMRPLEVCWLHRNNFDECFTYLEYKIAKPKHELINGVLTKVYKSRPVTIPKELAIKLSFYWNGLRWLSPYGFLFPSSSESRFRKKLFFMSPRCLNKEMSRFRKTFGGRWLELTEEGDHVIMPRSFRISWITRFGKKCKDVFKTAKAIEHEDPRTTMAYFDPIDLEEIRRFQDYEEVVLDNPGMSSDQMMLTAYA